MKEIKLTQGKFALVDDEDFEYLNRFRWYACHCGNGYYAARNISFNYKRKLIWMHRVIMDTPIEMQVDHTDHNGLNNQRSNLRNCTRTQNQMNKTPRGKSKYLGVSKIDLKKGKKTYSYIRAQIKMDKKTINLGRYRTEEDAARAYDIAAKKHHGEFANLNFK